MNVLFGTNFSVQQSIVETFSNDKAYNLKFIIPENYDDETLLQYAPETDILIRQSVTKEFLEKATHLKHIQVPWTGSNRMDFDLLKKYPNITVSNSHSNSLTIAEHAVALLLAVAKQITYRDSHMRSGDWSPRNEKGMYSFPLIGKTVGIIGYGAIGQKSAKMLKFGFNMNILAVKRHPNSVDDSICDFLGSMEDISKILKESDFIIIALPLTAETRGIINREQFKLMKEGVVIVNVGRGAIIDEKSLYDFLKSKKGYAGIDVWYNYPEEEAEDKKTFQNYPFEELDNIIMSPHSAFKVEDIGMKTGEDIITNLKLLSAGQRPINLLNYDLGY